MLADMEKTFTNEQVLDVILGRIKKSSLRAVAKEIEVSPAYLSDITRGRRAISDAIAEKFGFDRTVKTTVVYTFTKK